MAYNFSIVTKLVLFSLISTLSLVSCEKEDSFTQNRNIDSNTKSTLENRDKSNESKLTFNEETANENLLSISSQINNDSSVTFTIINDSIENIFEIKVEFLLSNGTTNSYITRKVYNENNDVVHMIKNNYIYTKYVYPLDNSIELERRVLYELPNTEIKSLSKYQNLAANFVMDNYSESDYLDYFDTDTLGTKIVGACISFARSRSIAKRDCNMMNNIYHYHTDCSYVGTDCACFYDDYWCLCTSYWDC